MSGVETIVFRILNGSAGIHYDGSDLTLLVSNMLSKPSPFQSGQYFHISSHFVVHEIIVRNGLLRKDNSSGWIDRMGNFYGCDFGWHEYLLYWMNKEVSDVEDGGWARVDETSYQCRFRLSTSQRNRLCQNGLYIDRMDEMSRNIFFV